METKPFSIPFTEGRNTISMYSVYAQCDLQISQVKCRVPTGKRSQKVTIDIDAILNDFQIMGNGLIKSIEVISDSKS